MLEDCVCMVQKCSTAHLRAALGFEEVGCHFAGWLRMPNECLLTAECM